MAKITAPVQTDALSFIAQTPAELMLSETPCLHCSGKGHYTELKSFNETLKKIVCDTCTFETSAMVLGFDEILLNRWKEGSHTRTPVLRSLKERANNKSTPLKCDAFIWRNLKGNTRFALANLAQLSPEKVAELQLTREKYNSGKLTLTVTDFSEHQNKVVFDDEQQMADFANQLIAKKITEPCEEIELIAIKPIEISELANLAILPITNRSYFNRLSALCGNKFCFANSHIRAPPIPNYC